MTPRAQGWMLAALVAAAVLLVVLDAWAFGTSWA